MRAECLRAAISPCVCAHSPAASQVDPKTPDDRIRHSSAALQCCAGVPGVGTGADGRRSRLVLLGCHGQPAAGAAGAAAGGAGPAEEADCGEALALIMTSRGSRNYLSQHAGLQTSLPQHPRRHFRISQLPQVVLHVLIVRCSAGFPKPSAARRHRQEGRAPEAAGHPLGSCEFRFIECSRCSTSSNTLPSTSCWAAGIVASSFAVPAEAAVRASLLRARPSWIILLPSRHDIAVLISQAAAHRHPVPALPAAAEHPKPAAHTRHFQPQGTSPFSSKMRASWLYTANLVHSLGQQRYRLILERCLRTASARPT